MEGQHCSKRFSSAEDGSEQRSTLGRHGLNESDGLIPGYLYEIDHKHLPFNSPNELKAIRVVMLAVKNELSVSVRLPSSLALRTYFRFQSQVDQFKLYPKLDVGVRLDRRLAKEVLIRQILPPELQAQGRLPSFWMVTQNVIDETLSSSLEENTPAPSLVKEEDVALSDMNSAEESQPGHKIIKRQKLFYCRWFRERYKNAEVKMLEILKQTGAVHGKPMLCPALRVMAKKKIGDPKLLEHLLKHMSGKVAPNGINRFCSCRNADGAMEYWLESVDKYNVRKEAAVSDAYWTPQTGWKHEDILSQDPKALLELGTNTIIFVLYLHHLKLLLYAADSRASKRQANGKIKVKCDIHQKFKVYGPFVVLASGSRSSSSNMFKELVKIYRRSSPATTLLQFCDMVEASVLEGRKNSPPKPKPNRKPKKDPFNSFLVGCVSLENGDFKYQGYVEMNSNDLTNRTIKQLVITEWLNITDWKKVSNVDEAKKRVVEAMAKVVQSKDSCGGAIEIVSLGVDENGELEEENILNIQEELCKERGLQQNPPKEKYKSSTEVMIGKRRFVDDQGCLKTIALQDGYRKHHTPNVGKRRKVDKESQEVNC